MIRAVVRAGAEGLACARGHFSPCRGLDRRAGTRIEINFTLQPGVFTEAITVVGTRVAGGPETLGRLPGSSLPQRLPDTMLGRGFLARYGGTTDAVTRVLPDREYRVRVATQHPIHEHFRVRTFAELLAGPPTERSRALLGELMYQSHASYSACGLGSEATDLLVALVREAGSARGFFGAKITGGGTVAVLGRKGADIAEIANGFERRLGRRPRVFSGSSPGAAAFGSIPLDARGVAAQ